MNNLLLVNVRQIVGYSKWRSVARGKQANELARVPPVEPSKNIISCTKFGWEWLGPAIGKFGSAPCELRNGINVSILFVLWAIRLTSFFQINFCRRCCSMNRQSEFQQRKLWNTLTLMIWKRPISEKPWPCAETAIIWNRNLIWCPSLLGIATFWKLLASLKHFSCH